MFSPVSPEIDQLYMRRCLQLATNGRATCAPNPMVGAVIVRDGRIISEGWHQKTGQPHAEPNAIYAVNDERLLKDATLYVSLEPCSHYGKTPPCADLIIQKQIPRVVIGTPDIFPLVSGRGIAKLRAAGTDVTVGVEKEACYELNRRFFTFHTLKRPFIILKWARTADGYVDYQREPYGSGQQLKISTPFTQVLAHKDRAECDAILVGTRTALLDDPELNVRDWSGKNPVRVVVDRNLTLSSALHLFDGSQETLVFTEKNAVNSQNLTFLTLDFNEDMLTKILQSLYERNLQTLLVEGGSRLHDSFLKAGLWDELHVETSAQIIRKGIPAPDISHVGSHCFFEASFQEGKFFRTIQRYRSQNNWLLARNGHTL
ncbi:MAG: bifunctional diaminohydroxyphosphoribosylaminopyrimidine deaminase/5-amino-6-(5-phosphoribosylamino)uracil reductase RibD [Bacteroidota bacterium]|nr:bifunctional diaminohydroxyphosphoribosylaminopyrimidine deaminase/5-amino-6-(5-phosphoribosylamino)uracil reductase RibD [Bacteroidota bacterium]